MESLKRMDAIVGQIVTLVVTVAVAYGVISLGPEAATEAATTITAGIMAIGELIYATWLHMRVTPVRDPKNDEGQPLVPESEILA